MHTVQHSCARNAASPSCPITVGCAPYVAANAAQTRQAAPAASTSSTSGSNGSSNSSSSSRQPMRCNRHAPHRLCYINAALWQRAQRTHRSGLAAPGTPGATADPRPQLHTSGQRPAAAGTCDTRQQEGRAQPRQQGAGGTGAGGKARAVGARPSQLICPSADRLSMLNESAQPSLTGC